MSLCFKFQFPHVHCQYIQLVNTLLVNTVNFCVLIFYTVSLLNSVLGRVFFLFFCLFQWIPCDFLRRDSYHLQIEIVLFLSFKSMCLIFIFGALLQWLYHPEESRPSLFKSCILAGSHPGFGTWVLDLQLWAVVPVAVQLSESLWSAWFIWCCRGSHQFLLWLPDRVSGASQCLLWGAGLWQLLLLVLSGCPGVSVWKVESQAHGHTEASWTGILVTASLFLVLLTHPSPRNVLTWLSKIKLYASSYFK